MTIQDIQEDIIFECISGSKAYGLANPNSDTDIRGVFILPQNMFYGLSPIDQVQDEKSDIVYYELGKFMQLLSKNNPNILELLAMPKDCILKQDPIFEQLKLTDFLSKKCELTFAGYAIAQIKKARGLNKKIHNPMSKQRKTILDFCHVVYQNGSMPLLKWLKKNKLNQKNCGLANISNMKDMYALFHNSELNYKGILKNELSTELSLSSIPKGEMALTWLYYNQDGYSKYCKDFKAYWKWVKNRNEARYENTLNHGKNYDSKNMMHTFRLLNMAEEIALENKINVKRPERKFLLEIRAGNFNFTELMEKAEAKIHKIKNLFAASDLPQKPNLKQLNTLLVQIRKSYYQR